MFHTRELSRVGSLDFYVCFYNDGCVRHMVVDLNVARIEGTALCLREMKGSIRGRKKIRVSRCKHAGESRSNGGLTMGVNQSIG